MRRRRPQIVLTMLFVFTVCEVEVVLSLISLGHQVHTPSLAYALTRVAPVIAFVLALGPFAHVPTTFAGRRLPGWGLTMLAPSSVFVLACFVYGVFAAVSVGVRAAFRLPVASMQMQAIGLALPFVLAAHGVSAGQLWTRVERVAMPLRGLGAGLSGLRVVQLSDLHAGGLVGVRRLERIARKVARLKPDMVVITGDIVNANPRDAETVAAVLTKLKPPMGLWACLGNHDHFVDGNAVAAILERAGIRVLRNQGQEIRRGDGAFWLAGVDDTWTRSDDLEAALAEKPAGLPTLLLAHDPNLWPQAVARSVEWTLSGHTHGGQVGLLKLHRSLSLARLITPFVAGRYERDGAVLYVSRGTANTLPLRLGAPTEVGLFELQAA
jgi:uncharacterized protein